MTASPDAKESDSPQGEWREGWGFYRAAGADLRQWCIGVSVSIGLGKRYNREWGLYLYFGPFYAWATLEHEDRLFVGGKRTDLAMAPCD